MMTPIHQICVKVMNQTNELMGAVPPECLPWKFAKNHLDECTYTECPFCSTNQCCFGMRDVGCPVLHTGILHQTDHVSSVVLAAYKAGFCEPHEIKEITEGLIDLIMPIKENSVEKSFSFIFDGVEFTPRDHASDQTSCPHCFADNHDIKHPERHQGFLGYKKLNKEKCVACFRCINCFSTFFYHVNRSWVEKWQ